MTNGEKYKTAQERADAFLNFCDKDNTDCIGCPLYDNSSEPRTCAIHWLYLEADEEKLETLEDIVDEMRQHTRVSAADAFYGVTEWTKLCDRIVAAHNRVAKKCREGK